MEETDQHVQWVRQTTRSRGARARMDIEGTPGAFLAIVRTCALSVGAVATLGGWSRNVTASDVCGW